MKAVMNGRRSFVPVFLRIFLTLGLVVTLLNPISEVTTSKASAASSQYSFDFNTGANNTLMKTADGVGPIPASSDFTVEAWVYVDAKVTNGWQTILVQDQSSAAMGAARFYVGFYSTDAYLHLGAAGQAINTTYQMQTSTWTHVAVSVDRIDATNSTAILYINGTSTYTWNFTTVSFSKASGFSLGTATDGGYELDGKLDQVKIWSGVLSAADINVSKTAYSSRGITTGTLSAHYDFNEGSGSTITDRSSSGNSLTLTTGNSVFSQSPTPPSTTPGSITSLSGTSGSTQVALSWTAPDFNGGSAITDYLVEYSTDGSNFTTFVDGTSTATSATVTGLTNGNTYTFRVSAINSIGTGNTSSTIGSTPMGTQNALSITTTSGTVGTPLSLTTSGGNGSGSVTYTYSAGTTTCSLSGSTLTANGAGTCLITATKAADSSFNATSSTQTTITFSYAACAPISDTSTVAGYTILSFTTTGSCQWTTPNGVTKADYLIVGGGGAGGGGIGGGGGGGEFVEKTNQNVSGAIIVTVGQGGTGGSGNGANGGTSTFNSVNAVGGGGGGANASNGISNSYGSGGGAGYSGTGGTVTSNSPSGGFANSGGAGSNGGAATANAGGGGGAGGAGSAGTQTPQSGGNGGAGKQSAITNNYYAGGGGGGLNGVSGFSNGSPGSGSNGGGDGGPKSPGDQIGLNATANSGSGGGGASNAVPGGNGGSGIVVVKYVNAPSISLSTNNISASFGSPISSYSITNSGGPATASTGYSIPSSDNTAITAVGLSFSTATGLLSGTPTGTLASRNITITATNTSGTSTATFALSVSYNTCTPTTDTATVTGYTIQKFTNAFSCTWTIPTGVTSASVLVVGGGGGGAGTYGTGVGASGGGGGAGGVYEASNVPLTPGQSATITVGSGGNGGAGTTNRPGSEGSQGGDSSFALTGGTISAGGGGGGGCGAATTQTSNIVCPVATMGGRAGTAGGSGGGSTPPWNAYNWGAAGTGSSVTIGGTTFGAQTGYIGATYTSGGSPGGGSRGAATSSAKGAGLTTSISGTSVTYGTGGGATQVSGWTFSSTTSGFGNGGDGAYVASGGNISGANGAPGIVIVKYASTNTYTYDLNGGTGTIPTGGSGATGASFTTASKTGLTKTGYVFNNWNTAANGSGSSFSENTSSTIPATNGSFTLYAQWTQTYTATVNQGTNGTISPSTTEVASGSNQTFTFTPSSGYGVKSITIDGTALTGSALRNAIGSGYTFTNVTAVHSVSASYSAIYSSTLLFNLDAASTNSLSAAVGSTSPTWTSVSPGTSTKSGTGSAATSVYNTPSVAPPKSILFDNTSGQVAPNGNYINMGNDSADQLAASGSAVAMTLETWINFKSFRASASQWDIIASKWFASTSRTENSSNEFHFGLLRDAANTVTRLNLYARDADSVGCESLWGTKNFTSSDLNTWMHLSFTIDTSGNARIYINGVQDASSATCTMTAKPNAILFIGDPGANTGFNGYISKFRIYKSALTASQIQENFNSDAASFGLNPRYQITYNYASATSGNSTASDYYTVGGTAITLPTPLKSGFTFAGWFDASSGGNKIGDAASTYSPNSSATLYAQWTANTNNAITYNNQSATTAQSGGSTTYTTAQAIATIPTTAPLKTGYTFAGWFTASSGGTQVTNGSYTPASPYGSVTLYAQWTANTNNAITYNNQSATTAQSGGSTTYTTGQAIATIPTTSPLKSGYTFAGWFTASSGGTQVTNGSYTPASPYGSVTLYAQWTANTNNAITYNNQSATTAQSGGSTTYTTAQAIATIPTTAPLKTGYTFAGWFTASSGGTQVTNGSYTPASPYGSVTLYAQWTANTNNAITYNNQSATTAQSGGSTTYTTGQAISTIPTTAPTKTGFAFDGWYTASSGGTKVTDGSYTPPSPYGSVTLYAQWVSPPGVVNAPNAPSSVTSNGEGGGIKLTWSAPVSKAGITVTGYQVEYSTTGSAGSWTIASSSIASNVTNYQIAGLTNGSSYFTRVAAKFSGGLGAYGYPWQKVYGTVTSTRQTVNGVAGSIKYETGFGITAGDAFSSISSFTRIRYLMKATYSGNANYADVDFAKGLQNASTSNSTGYTLDSATNIRIPGINSGQGFVTQGDVYDMTVQAPSTVSVQNGYGFNGRVEIWPWNYDITPVNVAATSIAMTSRAPGTFDDADLPGATNTIYGSFQLHNITNNGADYRQTVFAWNRHDPTLTAAEIGFGNSPSGNSDWTFCVNAGGACDGLPRSNFSLEIFVNSPTIAATAFAVTYDNQGATTAESGGSSTYASGYAITAIPTTAPLKTGYTFGGWWTQINGGGTQVTNGSYSPASPYVDITLYAKWTANTNNAITYDNQSATTAQSGGSTTYTTAQAIATIPTTAPLKTGYTFAGWFTASSGGTQVTNGSYTPASPYGSVTLYAQWTANTNNAITYNNQSATTAQNGGSTTYTTAQAISTIPTTAPLKTGYTFAGWFTASSGGTQVTNGSYTPASPYGSVTLYAQWTANNNAVIFDSNGGSGSMSNQTISSGVATQISFNTFTKSNYSFAGWNTNPDGVSGTSYSDGQTITINSGMTLYAVWNTDKYFELDGQSDYATNTSFTVPSNNIYTSEVWWQAPATFPSRTGDATGQYGLFSIGNGSSSSLYIFSSSNHSLTVYMNNVLLGSYSISTGKTAWHHVALVRNGSALTLYFDGNAVLNNLNLSSGLIGSGIKIGAFYDGARWGAGKFDQFKLWDVALTQAQLQASSSTYNFSTSTPTASHLLLHYNFNEDTGPTIFNRAQNIGFNLTISGNPTFNNLSQSLFDTSNSVTYDANGATSGSAPSTQSKLLNTDLTLASNSGILVKTGYTFAGWNTAANGNGTDYAVSSTFTLNTSLALYAKWTANTNNAITYDNQSATTAQSGGSTTYTTAQAIATIPTTAPLKTGYTFGGWWTQINGGGTQVTNASYMPASPYGSITLYAKWTINTYTVTYNANGSSSGSVPTDASSPYNYGSTITVLSNSGSLVKTSNTFVGWNTAANGSGTDYLPAATFTLGTANVTLYAQWVATCSITSDTSSSPGYTLYKITSTGKCAWTNTTGLTSLEFAAVGGGGGAAFGSLGGGGGAGRVIVSSSPLTVGTNSVVVITVGTGGAGGFVSWTNGTTYDWRAGSNGSASSIKIGSNTYSAAGGGGGGGGATSVAGSVGGSGGGGGGSGSSAGGAAESSTISNFNVYGNAGSAGNSNTGGGGGGGAGTAGGKNCDGTNAASIKTGGCGRVVWGISVAGGGGGWASGGVVSGFGGGAALGGQTTLANSGTAGTNGTGGGGGGGNAGGSGIVLIRFVNAYTVTYQYNSATGGNTDTSATYTTGGTAITLPTPTKTGYSFGGWYKEPNFTTLIGAGGATYTPNDSSMTLTIYAKWNASTLTVTFDAQGGSTVTDGSTTTGGTVTAPTAPTRAGYTLSGWAATSNGSTISFPYTHGQTANFTLYAIWSANSLTITYDAKGGTAVSSGTTTTGGSISAAPTAPTKSGYTFAGWSATDGGSAVTFAYIHGKTANFTMYALWSAVNYTVTYSLNGGSGSAPTETTKTIGQTFSVASIGASSKSGYTFGGWSDGSTTYQATNTYTVSSSNIVLTAQWNLAVYVVTYNSNSGTGSGSRTSENYTYGSTAITLPSIGNLARTGYAFGGWSTSSGVSATPISGTYTPTASITLYAVWNPVTYTISFNSSGGGTAPTSVTYTTGGSTVTLPLAGSMSKTGYDFSGWATSANGTVLTNTGYTVSADTTLYAKWTIKSISYSYALGTAVAGTSIPVGGSSNYATSITLGTPASSYVDGATTYIFQGWNDGTSTYQAGATYLINSTSSITFTAQWVVIYGVRYAINGGTFAVGENDKDSECTQPGYSCTAALVITANAAPSKSGYTFAGWKDQSNSTIAAGASWTITSNSYLAYAQWTPIAYTITYDSNGGTTAPTDTDKNIGQLVTVASAVTRTGYTFAGWRSGGVDYGPGATLQVGTSNLTFVAQWTAINYTLVYDSNGGAAVNTPTSSKTYQESFNTAAAPSRDGYTFAGWNDGTSTISAATSTNMPAGNLTLTAQWTAINYSVTYDLNGGTGSPSNLINRHIGDTFTVEAGVTRSARNFLGWYDGTNTYMPGQSYIVGNSNVTLTATWSGQLYSITYAKNGATGNAPTENDRLENEQITVAAGTGLSKRGFEFGGWEDGAGNTYQAGNSVTVRTSSLTLTAKWNATQYFTSYVSGTNASTHNEDTFNIGGSAITLPTPTRSNFHFDGWYDASSGGSKVGNGGESHTPTSTRTLYGRWTQNSLVGYTGNTASPAFSINVADNATAYTQSATAYGSSVAVSVPAGALPVNTAIKTFITNNNSNASSILSGDKQVLLSAIISWLKSDETVPDTDPANPITVTVTNSAIKVGSALYILNNGVATYVGTATSDGTATFNITSDPEVVIAAVAPGAPTGVTGTSGSGSVSLSWSAPTSNGGATITGYTVTSSPSVTAPAGCTNTASTSCTFTGLTNGTAYTFTVTATNSAGTSVASSSSSPVTPQGSTSVSISTSSTGTYGVSQNIVATTSGASAGTAEFQVGGVTINGCSSVTVSNSSATCAWTPASADASAALTAIFTPSGNSSTPSTSSTVNVNVGARAITIDAANKTAAYTGSAVSVTNSYTVSSGSLINGDSISSISYSYSTANPTNVGTYTITPSGAVFGSGTSSNYTITYTTGTLTISANALVLAFGSAPSGVSLGESAGTHSVSASTTPNGIGSTTFASSTTSVCTVNSTTGALTILESGVCTITADNTGDSNHSAASQDTQSFNVAPIVITFDSNGAGSAAATQNVTSLNSALLNSNTFSRSSFTFNGWNTVAGGTGTSYADGASITPSSSLTLYAQWTAVSAPSNGGGGGGGGSSAPAEPAPSQPSSSGNVSKPVVPQGVPVTTVGDSSANVQINISGKITDASIKTVDQKYVSKVEVIDGKLTLTPATGFSGKQTVTVSTVVDGNVVDVQVALTVLPEPVVAISATPKTSSTAGIKWEQSPNAQKYDVYLNGKKLCSTAGDSCNFKSLVGPKDKVEIVAIGGDETKSEKVLVGYQAEKPVLVNKIIGSTRIKSTLTATDKSALNKVIALIKKHGFTDVVLNQVSTNSSNKAAADKRMEAIQSYIQKGVGKTDLNFTVTKPTKQTVINNISLK